MEDVPVKKPFPISRFIHFGGFRYYYAYGNTPADDLLQNAYGTAKEPSILLLGCGDLRSCFYTLWKNFRSGVSRQFEGVHFVLNDNSSAVIARDVIFLHLCLKMPQERIAFTKWISAMWAIWYSHQLHEDHQKVLEDALDNVIAVSRSSSMWSSRDNPLNKLVKFTSSYTLGEVRKMWIMWRQRQVRVKSVNCMNKDRLAEINAKIPKVEEASYGAIIGSLCTLLIKNTPDCIQERMRREVSEYMRIGTSFAEDVLVGGVVKGKTTVNLTFYEQEDGKYTMHYGSVPFKCFYHTVQFSRQKLKAAAVSKSTLEQLFVEDSYFESLPFLANSVQQFCLWLRSSATMLKQVDSATSTPPISFAFHCSDAIEFCVHLQTPAFAQSLDCKTCFDLVYSSNLADHLALPNLVLAVLPLIKPGGRLFTTTLLYKLIAQTAEECIKILFGLDIDLIPAVLGVRCINHEGHPYSNDVSIQPRPWEIGHMFAVKQWRKVLIWEKLNCLPLKHPTLLSKCDVIAANLCFAVCSAATPFTKNVDSFGTINHLCVETAMQILQSFASRVEGDTSSHLFWHPLATLIQKRLDIVPYLQCLQTQALLHGIHLHLTVDEGSCPLCLKIPLTSYLSLVEVEIGSLPSMTTPTFLVYVHQASSISYDVINFNLHLTAIQNPNVHIIDSLNGVYKDEQLSLHFHVPLSFVSSNYYFTVISYMRGQVLDREVNVPSVLATKKIKDHTVSELSYSFLCTPPTSPAPVTAMGALLTLVADGKLFEAVVVVSEAVIPHLSSLSVLGDNPSEIQLVIRSQKYVIMCPYPVDHEQLSIKVSRKKREIAVLASRLAYVLEHEKPLFVVNTSDDFAKLRVPLSEQNMIAFSGMQFTKEDRETMERCGRKAALMPAMINLKESMNFFFQCQKEHFFTIAIPKNNVHALVVVQDRIYDLQHRSPAVDMAFCFLEVSFVATVASKWQLIAPSPGTRCIVVDKAELDLLKKVLVYFARRTVGCSLSKAKGHFHLLKRQKIDQYFTRAIVYPLFADPDSYVVNMQLAGSSFSSLLTDEQTRESPKIAEEKPTAACNKKYACANCGVKDREMKKCADCGEVKYCSQECQKKNWKVHKRTCKKTSSTLRCKNASSDNCVLDKSHCNFCGEKVTNLKKCGACGRSWYCSQDCQRKDWKEHKKACKVTRETVPASLGVLSATNPSDSTKTMCGGCEKESSSLRLCPCRKIAYCSISCQRMDWTRHKVECTFKKSAE